MPRSPQDLRLVRFLIRHALIGIATGWCLLVVLFSTNAFGLRQLVSADPQGWIAVLLIAVGFAITFGSAAMGTAIFLLSPDDDPQND